MVDCQAQPESKHELTRSIDLFAQLFIYNSSYECSLVNLNPIATADILSIRQYIPITSTTPSPPPRPPTLPYPTLPYPTLPYSTLPSPTPTYPRLNLTLSNLTYGPPNRVRIMWTAGWVESGDKWMMMTTLG